MNHRVIQVATLATFVAIACGRERLPVSEKTPDSVRLAGRNAGGTARVWDDSLGPVIATPSIQNGTPVLFLNDTANTAELAVELFTHEGQTTRATLRPLAHRHQCAWERGAVLLPDADQSLPVAWLLALAPGVATPIAIDGIGDLLPRDSAALAVRIHRLVSALPDDSVSAPFRGLPILVRDAWRFQLEEGGTAVVAVAMRALNVESNPRAEVTTILMEPDTAAGTDAWRPGFARRDAGPEDRVEGTDLLAAVRLRSGRSAVALAREGENGLQVDIVERAEPGSWHVRWSSAALPCAR